MAFKSSVFLIFCLVSLVSQGLARLSSSRLSPSISPKPSKQLLGCWSASFDVAKCSGELLRATQGGLLDLSIWPDCCKASASMSSGCFSQVFPFDPFFPQILQLYCPGLSVTPPPSPIIPNSQGPSSISPVGPPASSADGPIMDAYGDQDVNAPPSVAPLRLLRDRV
ncbi:hypothetical protein L1987_31197 [Smallanthus sonchifolius]|uniref:Uncharacterized protein n=1 Tax=Smallanthus sonchifolius TaxID=185202 RepID=A0ACB9I4A6_9ASTR|nr:hypothetical protein L1987_31197 [Smallanthus sonchifolius]